MHEINRATAFTLQELEKLQGVFRNVYEKRRQGITKKTFLGLVQASAPVSPDSLLIHCSSKLSADSSDRLFA